MVFIYPSVEQTTLANMMIFKKKLTYLYLQLFDMENDAIFFPNEILHPAVYHSTYIFTLNCVCVKPRTQTVCVHWLAIMGLATAFALKSEILKIKTKCVTGSFFFFFFRILKLKSFDSVGLLKLQLGMNRRKDLSLRRIRQRCIGKRRIGLQLPSMSGMSLFPLYLHKLSTA